jgi:hypothetical protein
MRSGDAHALQHTRVEELLCVSLGASSSPSLRVGHECVLSGLTAKTEARQELLLSIDAIMMLLMFIGCTSVYFLH